MSGPAPSPFHDQLMLVGGAGVLGTPHREVSAEQRHEAFAQAAAAHFGMGGKE